MKSATALYPRPLFYRTLTPSRFARHPSPEKGLVGRHFLGIDGASSSPNHGGTKAPPYEDTTAKPIDPIQPVGAIHESPAEKRTKMLRLFVGDGIGCLPLEGKGDRLRWMRCSRKAALQEDGKRMLRILHLIRHVPCHLLLKGEGLGCRHLLRTDGTSS